MDQNILFYNFTDETKSLCLYRQKYALLASTKPIKNQIKAKVFNIGLPYAV